VTGDITYRILKINIQAYGKKKICILYINVKTDGQATY
jgi:hypothetical protein